ncbi:MAG: hypothetical protein EAZ13_02160 [Sphingobacteriia bacterium]|nr:MAG: hypothetical protein EAZ41_09345 [Sphingobacteriia bacterium]TAG30947.1 MAG: hypothetical protein EAZ35_05270 [Sphingobacteriia bacterium]TAH08807.1 MAG: hypothetical protein EAZ13_02160 [Sphingobacteriia bacterium]
MAKINKNQHMKTKILIILTITAFFGGCKKSSFTTRPQISFGKLSATELRQGNIITFTINFTDKEGDIQDTIWVQKISKVCTSPPNVQFISPYPIPNFTATPNLEGKLELSFVYNANMPGVSSIVGCTNKNDTTFFKFWMKDKAQNRSDTIQSPDIVLIR